MLNAIKVQYELKNPLQVIDLTIGSSGSLYQQIFNGAGFDIYLAADNIYTHKLQEAGMVKGNIHNYAYGKLVLYSNTADVSRGIDLLNGPANKLSRGRAI